MRLGASSDCDAAEMRVNPGELKPIRDKIAEDADRYRGADLDGRCWTVTTP
jgi:hypothetical protein